MPWQPPTPGTHATWTRTFSAEDVEAFARITGDRNPLHVDPEFAARTRMGDLVVHRGLTAGLFGADGTAVLRGECVVYTMQPDGG